MPFWFSPEGPVFRPDEMKPDDFGLIIAFGPTSSEFKRARLIRFNSDADKTQSNGQLIEIPVAKPGNDSGGTVIRPDGIALQLHPLLKTTRMAVHEILNCIMDQLHAESAFRRFNS